MTIEAIFENGVLRPLQPLALREHENVTIQVLREDDAWLDNEIAEDYAAEADDSITLEDVRRALSTIKGSLDEAIDEDRGEY